VLKSFVKKFFAKKLILLTRQPQYPIPVDVLFCQKEIMSSEKTNKKILPSPDAVAKTGGGSFTKHELRIFQALRRIIRAIELHSRKLVTDHHVTGPQLVCLLALKAEEPLSVKELARQAVLSPSTIVGILDRLEEKELVGRCRSSNDRRSVLITLTEKGQRLLAGAPSPIQDSLARSLKKLPEEEMAFITLALEKVVDLMEACDLDTAPILETGFLAVHNPNGTGLP
jgi:DNA-binding MarR family transcriptional regulator